jgi:predicted acetyltransferase
MSVRELEGEERLEAIFELGSYAFHASPPFQDREERLEILRQRQGYRYFAAYEGARAVAGAAATQMTQNVRGKIFPANGVWGVATLPQARRKGYCRQVMADLLAARRADGQVFSCLYPFRESFYERMGYIVFPRARSAHFSPQALTPLLKQKAVGEVELVLIGDGFEEMRQFFYTLQPRWHGMAIFDHGDAARAQQNRAWLAKAVVDGQVAGMMVYNLSGEQVTQFHLRATRFYYLHSTARLLLLGWIARHVDQANQAEVWLPPWEYPETWLPDLGARTEPLFVAPMGRVLDVRGLNGLPVAAGKFSARVSDALCPWNEGTWAFEAVDGALQVASSQSAECSLTIQGLTALVYGVNDPDDFYLRGWGDPQPALQQAMRRMFPSRLPHLHEMF